MRSASKGGWYRPVGEVAVFPGRTSVELQSLLCPTLYHVTLILVAMNSDYAVQLSDRRLSVNGRSVDEETNKAVLIHARDGRLVAGYTGLGSYGSFRAHEFIAEVALEAATPDFSVAGVCQRFAAVATTKLNGHPDGSSVPTSQRHLTISLVGFGPDSRYGPATPGGLLVTNGFGDHPGPAKDHFIDTRVKRIRSGMDLTDITFIDAIGAAGGVTEGAVAPLRVMLSDHSPPEAIVGKGVELLRSWARQRSAGGTVGDQISSIVVPADITEGWTFDYHTAIAKDTVHYPITVDVTGRNPPAAFRLDVRQHEGAMAVPKVGRNHPCPCGSGLKYKRCHGPRAGGSRGKLI